MITAQANSDQNSDVAAPAAVSGQSAELSVSVDHPHHDAALVTVTGTVDTATAARLRELLHHRLTGCVRVVVLDLSAVTFFNTAALDMLQHSQQHAEQREVSLRIVPDSGRKVTRLLDILDLSHRFLLYPSTTHALATRTPATRQAETTEEAGARHRSA